MRGGGESREADGGETKWFRVLFLKQLERVGGLVVDQGEHLAMHAALQMAREHHGCCTANTGATATASHDRHWHSDAGAAAITRMQASQPSTLPAVIHCRSPPPVGHPPYLTTCCYKMSLCECASPSPAGVAKRVRVVHNTLTHIAAQSVTIIQ